MSPALAIILVFTNTDSAEAMHGAVPEQACPVLARSLSLDIAGGCMPVFMCSENRGCYSLSYNGTMDLQIACRPSFNTLFTLQSYPVIPDNMWSSVVFSPLADKLRSTTPLT